MAEKFPLLMIMIENISYNKTMKNDNIQYLIASLSARNDYISANELASYLHTTTRTIRNYVKQINENYQDEVILTSHRGYRWNGSRSFTPLLPQEEEFDTPDKRISHILRELCFLNTEDPSDLLSVSSLCDEMSVSERTLQIDLEDVRKTLKSFDIALHIKKDRLSLSGKESDLRCLIYHLINEHNSILQISHLEAVYPALSFKTLVPAIQEVLHRNGLQIDAYHIVPLTLRIVIQLMRLEHHHYLLSEEIQIPDITKRKEYAAGEKIIGLIRKQRDIGFSWAEQYYLTMLLICHCHFIDTKDMHEDPDIEGYADYCIRSIENHDRISYHEDHFPKRFADHLQRLLYCCRYRIDVANPLRSSLRINLPVLHNYTSWMAADIEKRFSVKLSGYQLSFLDLFFLSYRRNRKTRQFKICCTFICPDYFGLKDVLLQKIDDHFHRLISIDHCIDDLDLEDIPKSDMYISLLPLMNLPHFVKVSPALTGNDYRMIQNEISLIEQEKRYSQFEIFLRSYCKAEFFEKDHSFADKDQVISYLCKKLEKENMVSKGIIDDVIGRENADPTSYNSLVAIPHASTENVLHSCVYVLLNERPIRWGSRKVNLVIFMAMQRELNEDLEQFMDVIIRLFESKNNMKTMLDAKDYESFLEKLSKIARSH